MPLSLRLGVLALCLVLWVVAVAPRLTYGPKFSQDSASYIDCARSVSEGRGLMARPDGGLTHNLWEPMILWPPGYPLLMVPLMKFGVSPAVAATAIALIFSAICVVLLGNLYLTRLPTLLALSTLGATVLMPSFLLINGMAWSEAPFLALSLISLLCMMNWSEKTLNLWVWVLAAGVFGGLAWCVRNVAVALLGTSCLFLAVHLLWRPFRLVAKAIALWLLGWGVASSWLIYYNLNMFGKINPYSMPPSELSLWDNIKATSIVLLSDMSGSYQLGRIVTNEYILIGLLCITLLVLILWIHNCKLEKVARFTEKYRVEFLFSGYIAFILATTIVARTTYKWPGEVINSRHYVQIYWAIWLLISTLCLGLISKLDSKKYYFTLVFLIIACSSLQVRNYFDELKSWKDGFGIQQQRIQDAQILKGLIPHDKIVLSDRIQELRVVGDVHARRLKEIPLQISEMRKAGAEGFLWGIIIWDPRKCLRGGEGETARDLLLHLEQFPEFHLMQGWRQPLVLQYMEPPQVAP